MRIAVASTPVGPLGGGIGGGVELTLRGLVGGLVARGHRVEVVAPEGSVGPDGVVTHQIPGAWQVPSQTQARDVPVEMPAGSVLAAMWEWVRAHEASFDVVLDLAYDWLPLYLTPFLGVPVAHLVSMASLNDAMDDAVARAIAVRPGCAAVHSQAQADTFPVPKGALRVLGNGFDLERYRVRPVADAPAYLGAVGRISPEKGIDDLFAVAAATGLPVRAWGLMQDPACWADAQQAHPTAQVTHEGFLDTDGLQAAIGGCTALLMTPKWIEAFGNVAVEAMACGVPVIAYRRGGPAEIVVDGETGLLVEPDDVVAMADAVRRVDRIDRMACRRRAEREYSTGAFAERVEAWLHDVVAGRRSV